MSSAQNTHSPQNRRRRNPPSRAGIEMADATLIAIRESQILGNLDPRSTDGGRQFLRSETEQLLRNFGPRAREILAARHTPEFGMSAFGRRAIESWANVPLREVMYAMSTAHPDCLRLFRVFRGRLVEWVGDDSHRAEPKAPDEAAIEPSTDCTGKFDFDAGAVEDAARKLELSELGITVSDDEEATPWQNEHQ